MSSQYERRIGQQRLLDIEKVKDTLRKNMLIWVAPTVAFGIVGTLHALTKSDVWKASQALVVRDEAIGELGFSGRTPLGRFDNNDTLKRSLETILQIAKNRHVAGEALAFVGPAKSKRGTFPADKDIESFIEDISVSAPKGTEFGTSEVVYLSVEAKAPHRAVKLTEAVCDKLEARMQELRDSAATSIIAELQEKRDLAQRELSAITLKLSALEQNLGADLGEMRTLAESGSAGESNIRSQLNQIKSELRGAERRKEVQIELLKLLAQIGNDPDAILGTPNQLLESQPALRRLKDGLVDAQLRAASLRATFTDDHPQVLAATLHQRNVLEQLRMEIKNAYRSTQNDIVVNKGLVASAKAKMREVRKRLDKLAGLRAVYVNLTSEVSQRREQLRLASVALAEARGRQEAAKASSLISRLDTPATGSRPIGPGRLTLILGSTLGGLTLGLSLVYLLAPWQDLQRAGRRRTDQPSRRATDAIDQNDRRNRVPLLTDNRALQYKPLPDAVASLPSSSNTSVDSSLEHLTSIIDAK